MSVSRRPPECTFEARLDPVYLREGRALDRENRLIIDGAGEIVLCQGIHSNDTFFNPGYLSFIWGVLITERFIMPYLIVVSTEFQ